MKTSKVQPVLTQQLAYDRAGIIVYKDPEGNLMVAETISKQMAGRVFCLYELVRNANFILDNKLRNEGREALEKVNAKVDDNLDGVVQRLNNQFEHIQKLQHDVMKLEDKEPRLGWKK